MLNALTASLDPLNGHSKNKLFSEEHLSELMMHALLIEFLYQELMKRMFGEV